MKPSLRKAAILIASLDTPTADLLLEQMGPEQAARVRREIDSLDDVDPAEQKQILDEFRRGPGQPAAETTRSVELDLSSNRGSASAAVSLELSAAAAESEKPRMFRFLDDAPCESLAEYLGKEHPQTIAVVVSHLRADRAAEVLHLMPAAVQADVMQRLADLETADADILREMEQGLESWRNEQIRHRKRRADGVAAVSAILAAARPEARRDLLRNLAAKDEKFAGRWKAPPAERTLAGVKEKKPLESRSFAECTALTDAELRRWLELAPREVLVLGLAGAEAGFVERVLKLVPAERSRPLRKALAHLGPTRLSDIREAQQALASLAAEIRARIEPPAEAVGDARILAAA